MMQTITTIFIVTIIFIGFAYGTYYIWSKEKYIPIVEVNKKNVQLFDRKQSEERTIVKEEATDWTIFNGPDFSFKYPNTWLFFDVGAHSVGSYYFYEDGYSSAQATKKGLYTAIAVFRYTTDSATSIEIYEDELREMIFVDGYEGIKVTGINKESGNKEIHIIIPNIRTKYKINNQPVSVKISFRMPIKEEVDKVIFNKIIKTIEFHTLY